MVEGKDWEAWSAEKPSQLQLPKIPVAQSCQEHEAVCRKKILCREAEILLDINSFIRHNLTFHLLLRHQFYLSSS